MYIKGFVLSAIAMAMSVGVAAQLEASGTIDGHEYVDLGLSVKWATCNIGAEKPEDYGDYYAWGETETKASYTKENSSTYGKTSYTFLDAASDRWGSAWRMPTKAEYQELIDNCTWQWTTVDGHNGYRVTSKKNGNSIFLPAAGYRDGSTLYYAGEWGSYWSSQPNEGFSEGAYNLYFLSSRHNVFWNIRCYGYSLRPVTE